MLHSPDPARPFQVPNTHSWVVSENSDKAIEGATPLIRDRAIWLQTIFQKNVAALPVVTYQAGETVIAEGSRTGRLLILTKGVVAIVKEDTEIAQVAEPGAVFGELSALLGKPHTAEVRALETSQFHVANGATLFSRDLIAVLYVATALAHRLDAANHTLIQLKSQLKAGQPHSVVAKTVSEMEGLLAVSGASLVYAGYPFDPFARPDASSSW
jgi:CRP/FNR family transcriptional regulator, cyclic AMP receptor protein